MSYSTISNFGPNTYSPVNNPLTYCIGNNMEQRFLHGGHSDILGENSRECQLFMSDYCSNKWDGFCEIASNSQSTHHPNQVNCMSFVNKHTTSMDLTSGEILLYNTAAEKYLSKMNGAQKKYQPFDPTVATSPMISYWVSDNTSASVTPEYSVDPDTIDSDIVMDKILSKPSIAMPILINIYNTMRRNGTLHSLKGTKLGNFYNTHNYFKLKGGLQ
jgi:hypothetical protein